MRALLMALLLITGVALAAEEPVHALREIDQRAHGYVLGDRVPRIVEVDVAPGWTLQPASLPAPGPLDYWLELRRVDLAEEAGDGIVRHRITLEYQSFYAPLQAIERELPGFNIVFTRGDSSATAHFPVRVFTMAPLREIKLSRASSEGGASIALRPDREPAPWPMTTPAAWLAGALAGILVFLLLLARHAARWPFQRRTLRPFAVAARALRRQNGDHRARLRILHRAFDEAAGRRVLADDQAELLAARPELRPLASRIATFFSTSRLSFFDDDDAGALQRLPECELNALAHALARAERRRA